MGQPDNEYEHLRKGIESIADIKSTIAAKTTERDTIYTTRKRGISLDVAGREKKPNHLMADGSMSCDYAQKVTSLLQATQLVEQRKSNFASRMCPGKQALSEAQKKARQRRQGCSKKAPQRKQNYFKKSCDLADINPCGGVHRVIMKELRRSLQMIYLRLQKDIVATSFFTTKAAEGKQWSNSTSWLPSVIDEEV